MTDDTNTDETELTTGQEAPTKGSIRAQIFSSSNCHKKRIKVSFYGTELELRQPSVSEVEKLFDRDTNKISMVQVLIDHAYVPGTEEKVFTIADMDGLKDLPFSADVGRIADAIAKLTNVDVKAAEKN